MARQLLCSAPEGVHKKSPRAAGPRATQWSAQKFLNLLPELAPFGAQSAHWAALFIAPIGTLDSPWRRVGSSEAADICLATTPPSGDSLQSQF